MGEAKRDAARVRLRARLVRRLKAGARDESGASAVLFAVSLILIIPLMMGVFEIHYGSEQHAKLQDAMDASALFAARSTAMTTEELTVLGDKALKANLQMRDGATLRNVKFELVGQKVVGSATMEPASLLSPGSNLWHHPEFTVTTEVYRAMDKLEIALVLDNTGSMQGTKLTTLKSSAKDLVDKLKAAADRSTEVDPIKIALVPFSNTVRVQGTTALTNYNVTTHTGPGIPTWIDPQGKAHQVSGTNYDNFKDANVDRLALMKYMKRGSTQLSWEGCVEARRAPYDVQQDAPLAGVPATMYTPWFWPDEADNGATTFKPTGSSTTYAGSYNDYIDDIPLWVTGKAYIKGDLVRTVSGSTISYWKAANDNTSRTPGSSTTYWVTDTGRDVKPRQLNTTKYGNTASGTALKNTGSYALDSTAYGANGTYIYGPNGGCALQPVVRLTTNLPSIKTAIDNMTAVGETNIPLGLAWGWNALSPQAPFSDGSEYTKPHTRKIVILMTDGENTMNDPSKTAEPNGSFYGGYGYIWQNMLGVTSATSAVRTTKIDDRLKLLCENMKKKNIVIYTVRVEVSTGSSSLLQGCATTPDKFYDVQNVAQLGSVFDAIARSIDNLRISK